MELPDVLRAPSDDLEEELARLRAADDAARRDPLVARWQREALAELTRRHWTRVEPPTRLRRGSAASRHGDG